MKGRTILFILMGLAVAAGAIYFFINKNSDNNNGDSGIILFYGIGCPHCAVVDEYIKQNNIEEKVSFQKKEALFHPDNWELMIEKASICGLSTSTDDIGVPFLWDGSECFMGPTDIINFFNQKIGG